MSQKRKPKFGQNFLVDDNARHAIVDALGDISDRTVIEIGPGHGAITSLLAPRAKRLIAIELDHSLAAELMFKFRDQPHVTIHQGDILETDLAAMLIPLHAQAETQPRNAVILSEAINPRISAGDAPITADVIGNLPYYITSDILLKLFTEGRAGLLGRAVLMMQREVADRLSASPGVKDYGLLSATAQMNARVDNLFTLPPAAFNPPPDVFSTVLRLHFHPRFAELQVDPTGFDSFLKRIFAQKRKTLHNNLRAANFGPELLSCAWPAEIPPQARAESLPLETLALLYRALNSQIAPFIRATSQ